jgi:uncharacterized delta-60 repeat protein
MKSSIYKIRTLPLKILVGGSFTGYNGNVQNQIIRLNSNGTRDTSFIIGDGFSYDYASVEKIAIQSDGKIVVGGYFNSYNGTPQNSITRLNPDGTLDTSFVIGTGFQGTLDEFSAVAVFAIAVQSDGKIIVGGNFTDYNATTQDRITRLNSNGTRDTSFIIGNGFYNPEGGGAVFAITVQSDGKIIVGGSFTSYNETEQNYITRLLSNGTRDTSFDIGTGFDNSVKTIAVQSNNRILVGGNFTSYRGTPRNRIIRLESNGIRDTSFNIGTGFNDSVNTIAIQPDGKILVGGNFTSYDGRLTQNYIIRLFSNGTIDPSFDTGTGFDYPVKVIAIQPDGQILVGGQFVYYNETSGQEMFTRLNSDGTLNEFAPGGFNDTVNTILIS